MLAQDIQGNELGVDISSELTFSFRSSNISFVSMDDSSDEDALLFWSLDNRRDPAVLGVL